MGSPTASECGRPVPLPLLFGGLCLGFRDYGSGFRNFSGLGFRVRGLRLLNFVELYEA